MAGKFHNVILCEHITVDVNRKYSAIGIFSGDVLINEVPGLIRLGLLVEYVPDDDQPIDMSLEIEAFGEQILKGQGTVANSISGQPSIVTIPPMSLQIRSETRFRVWASVNGARRKRILDRAIRHDPTISRT